MYNESVVYVVGHSKTSSDNPITDQYSVFFLAFMVDTIDDTIVNVGGSFMLQETKDFVRELFVGQLFSEYSPKIVDRIRKRYWGSSQKAIIVAYKDALNRYLDEKSKLDSTSGVE